MASPGDDAAAEALAWLDDALEHVRVAGQARIEAYLRLIRKDLLEQMGYSERTSGKDRVPPGS